MPGTSPGSTRMPVSASATISGIARALAQLLDDAELRQGMGGSGRRRAEEEFSVARMELATARVYEKALRR